MNHLDLVPMTSPFLCFYLTAGTEPEKPNSETFFNPDTYTYSYLVMLVGENQLTKARIINIGKSFGTKIKTR